MLFLINKTMHSPYSMEYTRHHAWLGRNPYDFSCVFAIPAPIIISFRSLVFLRGCLTNNLELTPKSCPTQQRLFHSALGKWRTIWWLAYYCAFDLLTNFFAVKSCFIKPWGALGITTVSGCPSMSPPQFLQLFHRVKNAFSSLLAYLTTKSG